MQAEKAVLASLPVCTNLYVERPDEKLEEERAARTQELMTFCAVGGLTDFGKILYFY